MKKSQLIIIALGIFIAIALIFLMFFSLSPSNQNKQPVIKTTTTPNLLPTVTITTTHPINSDLLPTMPPSKGFGVDRQSPVIIGSQTEIAKLIPSLPYINKIKTSEGLDVNIYLKPEDYQKIPQILNTEISNIDFQVSPQNPNYNQIKNSFLEAANNIFSWVKSNGADPNKIIFIWADKKFDRERANQWLNEQ